jgi:hypothetical protein
VKDHIDDRLRMKGMQLTGAMPNLGVALDNLCNTYVQFFNSNDKTERIKLLGSLRLAAIDCQNKAKILIEMFDGTVFEGPLPGVNAALHQRVQYAVKYSQPGLDVGQNNYIHGAYLQLTQLAKGAVGIKPVLNPTPKEKDELKKEVCQYMFEVLTICKDIQELCLITSAEPEKGLVQ